jgi:ATP-dependent protease ClpP protease subunit
MAQGDARELEIANKEIQIAKDKMVDFLISKGLRGTKKKILKAIDRDRWMNAEEAIEAGVGDELLTPETYNLVLGNK